MKNGKMYEIKRWSRVETEKFQEVSKNKENNRNKRGKDGWVKSEKGPFSDSEAYWHWNFANNGFVKY